MGVAVGGRGPVTVNTGSRCGSNQGLPGGWVRCLALRLEEQKVAVGRRVPSLSQPAAVRIRRGPPVGGSHLSGDCQLQLLVSGFVSL